MRIHTTNINGSLRLDQMLAPGGATTAWNAIIIMSMRESMVGIWEVHGLPFLKRMEKMFDSIRTTNSIAKVESRSTMILRMWLDMLEIWYIIMAGRNMAQIMSGSMV